jgi:peroxiredoxin
VFGLAAALSIALLAALGDFAMFSVQRAPEVQFQTITGETIATGQLRGKVVLVNFWSTDCAPCIKEMPKIVDTYRRFHAQGFETVAVAMKHAPPHHVVAYADSNQLPFKVAIDVRGEVAQQFGHIRVTPTTFIIDRRGNIVKQYLGEPDFGQLHALLEKKLKEPA